MSREWRVALQAGSTEAVYAGEKCRFSLPTGVQMLGNKVKQRMRNRTEWRRVDRLVALVCAAVLTVGSADAAPCTDEELVSGFERVQWPQSEADTDAAPFQFGGFNITPPSGWSKATVMPDMGLAFHYAKGKLAIHRISVSELDEKTLDESAYDIWDLPALILSPVDVCESRESEADRAIREQFRQHHETFFKLSGDARYARKGNLRAYIAEVNSSSYEAASMITSENNAISYLQIVAVGDITPLLMRTVGTAREKGGGE